MQWAYEETSNKGIIRCLQDDKQWSRSDSSGGGEDVACEDNEQRLEIIIIIIIILSVGWEW